LIAISFLAENIMSGERRITGSYVSLRADNPLTGPTDFQTIPSVFSVYGGESLPFITTSGSLVSSYAAGSTTNVNLGFINTPAYFGSNLFIPIGNSAIPSFTSGSGSTAITMRTTHGVFRFLLGISGSFIGVAPVNAAGTGQFYPNVYVNLAVDTTAGGGVVTNYALNTPINTITAVAPAANLSNYLLPGNIFCPSLASGISYPVVFTLTVTNNSDHVFSGNFTLGISHS
jgi:hypothetical protein